MSEIKSDNCVLYVKHLPKELSLDDQRDLLKQFGAKDVICMGNKGPMKYSAFAEFDNNAIAWQALKKLHQLDVLGSTLLVQFSKKKFDAQKRLVNKVNIVEAKIKSISKDPDENNEDTSNKNVTTSVPDKVKVQDSIDQISEKWNVRYLFRNKLQYSYPAPSVGTITNIANALASFPKFYVQTLHLMNKMNLPAPFGHAREAPPLPHEPTHVQYSVPLSNEEMQVKEMEISSTEESELEDSDKDDTCSTVKDKHKPPKRKIKTHKHLLKKKFKMQSMMPQLSKSQVVKPEEVFEQPEVQGSKKMALKFGQIATVPAERTTDQNSAIQVTAKADTEVYDPCMPTTEQPPNTSFSEDRENVASLAVEGGFGKIEPNITSQTAEDNSDTSSDSDEGEWGADKFISSRKLRHGQLSRREMDEYSVFKSYKPGEPTTRLYVKNLAKQTGDKDLHYIFGRYVDWDNEIDKNMFDIRLMKEGRMKGQCFITLGSEEKAKEALKDTNAYVLKGKPMVVQFARSAKPKT